MDQGTKERFRVAIQLALRIVDVLNAAEWSRISMAIQLAYNAKAAKVNLDGHDKLCLEQTLHADLLGEPRVKAPLQSE